MQAISECPLTYLATRLQLSQAVALNRRNKYKSRCPGLKFDVTSTDDVALDKIGHMKPHLCCYTEGNLDTVRRSDRSSAVVLGHSELFVDIAPTPSRDFFIDPPVGADATSRASHEFLVGPSDTKELAIIQEAFGQHIAYVIEILARQPRTFLYTVSLAGSRARLLRWDRSGCIVTESFDIREQPDILCQFIWRFSQTTNAGRGHDMSISIARPGEEDTFRDIITRYVDSQLTEGEDLNKAVTQHYQPGQVFAVTLLPRGFNALDENLQRLLISRPVVTPLSLVGRGTWGYWAIDLKDKCVVFLKDTWRDKSSKEFEGDVLCRFFHKNVRNVPLVVWHGEVPDQSLNETRELTGELSATPSC